MIQKERCKIQKGTKILTEKERYSDKEIFKKDMDTIRKR